MVRVGVGKGGGRCSGMGRGQSEPLTLFPVRPGSVHPHVSPQSCSQAEPLHKEGLESSSAFPAGSYLHLMRNFKWEPSELCLCERECIRREQMIY